MTGQAAGPTGPEPPIMLDDVLQRLADEDRPAVVDLATGRQVTYRELARRTQVLTGLLAGHGVGLGTTVAFVLDKSIDAVVCMWATLRLGARYVPIDESLPPARVARILATCRPAVTVVHPAHLPQVAGARTGDLVSAGDPAGQPVAAVWLPDAEADFTAGPPSARRPADDAYVIFTSGSTGGPKGVVISHRSACALLAGVQQIVGFEAGTRYLNVTPLFFDASLVDLYSTFLVGGTVHLLPRLRMPTQITRACEDWQITDTLWVPSVIRMLVSRFSDLDRRDLSALRRVWFGGESCPVSLLRTLTAKLPGISLVHGYGPTETTHSATLYLTDQLGAEQNDFLPIGRPLPAVETLIVDHDLAPVPDGEIGELLIGGEQVMTGYCDDPDRTARVLLRLGPPPGVLYYRSGDFVRRRPDGELVFVGRRDDALKINGNLVHLSELESATLALDWVGDCCAIVTDHAVTGRAITLFVLGGDGEQGDLVTAVRRELTAQLPDYMLPASIVHVGDERVALTPAGKLDRDQLRALASPPSPPAARVHR